MDTGTVWNKDTVQHLLNTNDRAVVRALMAIYARQTTEEQQTQAATEHNGVGFSGVDAEILSSFAQFYQSHGYLTDKQMSLLRARIQKYWSQLLRIAQSKGHQVRLTPPKKPQQGTLL